MGKLELYILVFYILKVYNILDNILELMLFNFVYKYKLKFCSEYFRIVLWQNLYRGIL